MEQRIKIVWIFSIVSMLLITCGQVYWLRNQYQYMNDEQINDIYDRILQTTQQYDSIRTPQPKKGAQQCQYVLLSTEQIH